MPGPLGLWGIPLGPRKSFYPFLSLKSGDKMDHNIDNMGIVFWDFHGDISITNLISFFHQKYNGENHGIYDDSPPLDLGGSFSYPTYGEVMAKVMADF